MKPIRWLGVMGCIVVCTSFCLGQIPRTIAYQGVLSDSLGNPKPDGTYSMTFRLYDLVSGGSPLWTEAKTINVKRGLFSTQLGDQVVLGPTIRFDKPYWLGIQVAGGSELSPRTALTAVGYSFYSAYADSATSVKGSATPAGPAGGDLSGTYPNPTVKKMVRTLSFNANSLNYSNGGVITQFATGLIWKANYSSAAFLMIAKPSDWDGTSDVVLTLYFQTTSATAGNVDFFIRPRAFNPGDTFTDANSLGGTPVANSGSLKIYAQSFTIPYTSFGTKVLWVITIQNQGSGSTYTDDLYVHTVTLTYAAVR